MLDKQRTGVLIHVFAVASSSIAFSWLSQTVVGDEVAITDLVIAMITSVAKSKGKNWSYNQSRSFLGLFIGKYIGIRSATFIVKWIPLLGNGVNSKVTQFTTEVLGWATYLFVTEHDFDSISFLSDEDIDKLWENARETKGREQNDSRTSYNRINAHDKKKLEKIIRKLLNKNLTDEERGLYLNRFEKITGKYFK